MKTKSFPFLFLGGNGYVGNAKEDDERSTKVG
jgi:hypothetical protein